MFKRKIYRKLLDWKETSAGQTALLIEGARRIGKSTIVEEFAKNEYKSYIFIDFAFAPKNIHKLFENLHDLDYFFLQLQLQYGVDLYKRESLIVFDEVQFNPLARQAIKKLVADGRYDYLETGSLISIHKNVKDILIPSEERRIEMFPMDFEEFLWALGDGTTNDLLKKAFEGGLSLGEDQNRNMLQKFHLYMLVGGMPQAVKIYLESNNFRMVDEIKRDIIDLYLEDFYKIDPSGKISTLFEAIPGELSRNSSRYQVSSVLQNQRYSTILQEIAELKESKTVLVAYNTDDPNVGLSSTLNLDKFKLYMGDTGLMVTLIFKDKDFTENVIYKQLLGNKLQKNLGMVYENIVAQTLAFNLHRLVYYSFYDEEKKRTFEVDFILSEGNKVNPIEVKSSNYRVHRSLDAFSVKYSSRIKKKYLIHIKDYQREKDIIGLPFYMAQFL